VLIKIFTHIKLTYISCRKNIVCNFYGFNETKRQNRIVWHSENFTEI